MDATRHNTWQRIVQILGHCRAVVPGQPGLVE